MSAETATKLVERFLSKKMAVIGKGELAELIEVQYRAIERLMEEVLRLDPQSELIPKPRRDAAEKAAGNE